MNIKINFSAAQLLLTLLIEENARMKIAMQSDMPVEQELRFIERVNMIDSLCAIIQTAK